MIESDHDIAARWCSHGPGAVSWIDWEDGIVAYHRPSGVTHFLNLSSRVLIEDILREPKDVEQVAIALDVPEMPAADRPSLDDVRSMLERFEELGLIERV